MFGVSKKQFYELRSQVASLQIRSDDQRKAIRDLEYTNEKLKAESSMLYDYLGVKIVETPRDIRFVTDTSK